MENNLSMPELTAILEAKHKEDYDNKKFFAAINGIDIEKQAQKVNPWEAMKARVMSGGKTSDPNDILSLQGHAAQRAGFGVGAGLDYGVLE